MDKTFRCRAKDCQFNKKYNQCKLNTITISGEDRTCLNYIKESQGLGTLH